MNILVNAIDALEEASTRCEMLSKYTSINKYTSNSSECNVQRTPEAVKQRSNQITIRTEATDQRVRISICDNGPGMSEQTKQRLFEPFFTTKPVGRGTGLGLSISYQVVVDRHGGELRCVSTLGQGSAFLIELPLGQSYKTPNR